MLTSSLAQIYPLDAVFDSPEDVPEDIKARAGLAACSFRKSSKDLRCAQRSC